MKKIIIGLMAILVIGGGFYFLTKDSSTPAPVNPQEQIGQDENIATTTEDSAVGTEDSFEPIQLIGTSTGGHDITAYHYGKGDTELLFVGGIHGGYSWNTSLVAYDLMDYLEANSDILPGNVQVTVIPVLNPDGLYKVVGTTERFTKSDVSSNTVPGRFNDNDVDINRNFDCEWKATGIWQNKSVSGGSEPFSEPESQALKQYVQERSPDAVVVWYSAAGGVYASNCNNGILPETTTIMNLYADASGYPAYDDFDFYEITGDAVNWLAKNNVPAISVLLTTHDSTEWSKNKAGIEALIEHYAE